MTRVLLTGGSGFIAIHILKSLLERGHSVVTTVRSTSKAKSIQAICPNYGKNKLDFAIVEDIARDGAFDKAVVSDPPFEAVIHTASPFHFNVTDVQKDLLDPAINGTTGILQAIKKNAPSVRQVVITSSFAAIINPQKGAWPGHTYSEKDWNPVTQQEAAASIDNPFLGYRASKTFAERAAWEFVEREKPNFSLSTMCPPMVLGPVTPGLASLDALNTSNLLIRDMIQGKAKEKIPENATFVFADVRDIALSHVLAMEKPDAANKRFFIAAGLFSNKEIATVIRSSFAEYRNALPDGEMRGGDFPEGGMFGIDNSRATDVLGMKWRSLDESVTDTVKSLQTIGA